MKPIGILSLGLVLAGAGCNPPPSTSTDGALSDLSPYFDVDLGRPALIRCANDLLFRNGLHLSWPDPCMAPGAKSCQVVYDLPPLRIQRIEVTQVAQVQPRPMWTLSMSLFADQPPQRELDLQVDDSSTVATTSHAGPDFEPQGLEVGYQVQCQGGNNPPVWEFTWVVSGVRFYLEPDDDQR